MKKLYEKPSVRIVKVQSNDLLAAVSQSVDSTQVQISSFQKKMSLMIVGIIMKKRTIERTSLI